VPFVTILYHPILRVFSADTSLFKRLPRTLCISDDLPPLFVQPLKLEFVFIQIVGAWRKLSVSLQPFLEQVASIQAHYAVETYYTPYAIFQSALLLQTTSQISHSLEAHREIITPYMVLIFWTMPDTGH